MVPPDDAITSRRAPAFTAASKRPTELARLVLTCSPGSRAAFCTPPLEARCRTTSGLKPANAFSAPSDPQSAETTSTSPGSGSPHGWLWSSITSTIASGATSISTAGDPMKAAPPCRRAHRLGLTHLSGRGGEVEGAVLGVGDHQDGAPGSFQRRHHIALVPLHKWVVDRDRETQLLQHRDQLVATRVAGGVRVPHI